MGSDYINDDRFYPLKGAGRPLWEFKEHDHRLYCHRIVEKGKIVKVILFNGWVKDKRGKGEENQEIEKAQNLYREYLNE